MKNIRFEDLPKAMELAIEKLTMLEQELTDLKLNFQPKEPEELMTRKEAGDFLKINNTTLWYWTKKGKLKAYGIGARRYYKRSELNDALINLTKN